MAFIPVGFGSPDHEPDRRYRLTFHPSDGSEPVELIIGGCYGLTADRAHDTVRRMFERYGSADLIDAFGEMHSIGLDQVRAFVVTSWRPVH